MGLCVAKLFGGERETEGEWGRDCGNHVNNYNGYISDLCFFILGNVHKKRYRKKVQAASICIVWEVSRSC